MITSASPADSSRARQGLQRVGIGQHHFGLVERADHVLAERMVDPGLAAHRRIDLRQQRGGNLDEGHAALVARRREPGHVADHPAAQRDQRGLALGALGQQRIENQVQRFPVLVCFAVRQHHLRHRHPAGFQRRRQLRQIQRRHRGIGHDHHALLRQMRQDQPGLAQQAGADVDGVGAVAEVDGEGLHGEIR